MRLKLPRVKVDDEITTKHFNDLYEALEKLEIDVGPSSNLIIHKGTSGLSMAAAIRRGFWIKLTSNSSNSYAWTEQYAQSGGTWVNGQSSGTTGADPAHEINGNTTIPSLPVIVW